jgi:hypothetical protein
MRLLIRHDEVSISSCPFLTLSLRERAGVRGCGSILNRAASIELISSIGGLAKVVISNMKPGF